MQVSLEKVVVSKYSYIPLYLFPKRISLRIQFGIVKKKNNNPIKSEWRQVFKIFTTLKRFCLIIKVKEGLVELIKALICSPTSTIRKAILFLVHNQLIAHHVNTKGHITPASSTCIGNRSMHKSKMIGLICFSYRSLLMVF